MTDTNRPLPRSMWDSPQERARLLAIHLAFIDDLRSPDATPAMRTQLWAQRRTELFEETGREGLPGSGLVYNLVTDMGIHLISMCRTSSSQLTSDREKARGVLRTAEKAVGHRWKSGVSGLRQVLAERGVAQHRLMVFFAGRLAFEARFYSLADAVGTLSKERLHKPAAAAARGLVDALLGEVDEIVGWLEVAGLHADAKELRVHIDDARDALQNPPD